MLADLLTPGARFEDFLREGVARGVFDTGGAPTEIFVADHMNLPADHRKEIEIDLTDGRWLLVSRQRTSDGGTVHVRTDITRLKQHEQALRESEERLRGMLRELEESHAQLERQSFQLTRLANRAAEQQQTAEAASVAKSQFLANISHELRTPLNAILGFSEIMALHRDPQGPFEHPLTDGRWMLIEERRTSDGGIVGVRTDITRLKQQEQALREREEQLKATIAKLEQSESEMQRQAGILRDLACESAEQRERAVAASRAKSDFLAMMSHEIRSPLNGIIGNTDLLLDSPLAPSQRRSAEVVRQCGAALITVIDDILDFSKIEAGKLDLACEDFNLGESLEAVASMTRVAAQNKGLKLAVAIGEDVPRSVKGDENRLRQVLLNLVTNAVKFTEVGSIDIGVERTGASADRIMIRFTIRDTGIGIPLEAQSQLFDAFYQVDGSYRRKARGTGLGLAICRRLAHLMGGEIGVESLPGMVRMVSSNVVLSRSNTGLAPA